MLRDRCALYAVMRLDIADCGASPRLSGTARPSGALRLSVSKWFCPVSSVPFRFQPTKRGDATPRRGAAHPAASVSRRAAAPCAGRMHRACYTVHSTCSSSHATHAACSSHHPNRTAIACRWCLCAHSSSAISFLHRNTLCCSDRACVRACVFVRAKIGRAGAGYARWVLGLDGQRLRRPFK